MRISDIIAYVGKDGQRCASAGAASRKHLTTVLVVLTNAWATSALLRTLFEITGDLFSQKRRSKSRKQAKRENYQKDLWCIRNNGDFSGRLPVLRHEYESCPRRHSDQVFTVFKHHIEPVSRHLSRYGHTYDWKK